MNKKLRNHPIMILDYSMKYIVVAISLVLAGLIGTDANVIILVIGPTIVAGVLYLPLLAVFFFIYRKSYYKVMEDRVYIERKTVFGFKRKEIYFENVATIKIINKVVYIPFKAAELQFNTGSSTTMNKDDVRIYASTKQLELIEAAFDAFKNGNEIDVVTAEAEDSEVKVGSDNLIKKYTTRQSVMHTLYTEILGFLAILIITIPFILLELSISDKRILTLVIILLPLFAVFLDLFKVMVYMAKFKLFKNKESFTVSRGLFAETKSSVDFKDIKLITKVRSRIVKKSYLKIKAVGLIENEKTKNIDEVYSLFDINSETDKLVDIIGVDDSDLQELKLNLEYVSISSVCNQLFLLALMAICQILFGNVYVLVAFVIWQVILLIINVSYYFYYKHFVKFMYNHENIIIKRGLINEKTIIINKEDVQKIKVSSGPIPRLFNSCKLTVYNFVCDTDSGKHELNYIDNKQLNEVLEHLKAK